VCRITHPSIPLVLVATACAGNTNPELSEPGADVTGAWTGTFTEQDRPPQDAVSGEISISFVQDAAGLVGGQVALTRIDCLTTLEFVGTVADSFLIGAATAGEIELRFQVDARNADQGAYGTLDGIFNIISGAGCPLPFEGRFLATGVPPSQQLLLSD